jgi:hypothetical protein
MEKTKKIILAILVVMLGICSGFAEDIKEHSFNEIQVKNDTGHNIDVLIRSFGLEAAFFNKKVLRHTISKEVKDGDFNKVEYIQLNSPDVELQCEEVNCNTMEASEKSKTVKYTVKPKNKSGHPQIRIHIGEGKDRIKVKVTKDYDKHILYVDIK